MSRFHADQAAFTKFLGWPGLCCCMCVVRKRGPKRIVLIVTGVSLASSVVLAAWLLPTGRERSPVGFTAPRETPKWGAGKDTPLDLRNLALREAKVWTPKDVSAVDLAANPPDATGLLSQPVVRCRYVDRPARGTTAKFDCVLPDGEVVKVKYGHTGEIQAEIAASRLLAAFGFGADRMYMVPLVRCYGCVRTPYYTVKVLDYVHARERLVRSVPEDSYTDFEWVGVERRFDGAEIEAGGQEGWAWWELDPVDPSRGANRAERDALRLAAMLLAHWDNKAPNQRLMCLSSSSPDDGPCARPFAYIHDLGATFGPNKVDLDHWSKAPIWSDRGRCSVSMRQFPYKGGTFPDTQISEAGRRLIARQLTGLTERQLVALFTAARFPEFHGGRGADADPQRWAAVFLDKVRQIADSGPCPSN
jgi:hypothetical protein